MKKALYFMIIGLSLIGVLIEVVSYMFEDPFSFGRGLGLIRYFTIQSNLVVFSYFVLGLFDRFKKNDLYNRFLPGVVIYITITFVIFATMLQGTFEIKGIRVLGNYLVHYVVPILSIIYLFAYGTMKCSLKDIKLWIIYPLLYLVFLFGYGLITSDYLYPFFDINTVGVGFALLMVLGLIVFFLILSFITVKILSKKENANIS